MHRSTEDSALHSSTEQKPHASQNAPVPLASSHDDLLRQVDDELQKLTSTKAHSAFHTHVQECLDGYDHDPATFREAIASPQRNEWIAAMREELNSLHLNNTWDNTQTATQKKRGIGSKWVFKTKSNPDGTTRFKARLVIKGYRQVEGIDFKETYAPVSRLASLRILLAFASGNNSNCLWRIDHMDVTTAFLHPQIDQDDVLMDLPKLDNLGDLSEFGITLSSTNTVRLRKALYRLKQAPRLWYKEINSFLKSIGLTPSIMEPNLYMSKNVLLLYVDDILLF